MSEEPEQLSFDAVPAEPARGAPNATPAETEAPQAPSPTPPAVPIASPFPPTAEQAAAIDRRDRDIFLEAGAGTGKTRVLVGRYCDAIDLDGIEPERILAFTFTEKAAAEMRRRVRVELMRRSRASENPERRLRLQAAARAGEAAPITTIHGFCRRLLAAHPIAAGLDPHFRVLDAEEAGRLAALAFHTALEELAAGDDDIARLAAGYRNRLGSLIRAAYDDLRNHGQREPVLPDLQISAFDNAEQAPDPDEIALVDASYGAMRRLLGAFAAEYERVKAERSGVDFDDLQLLALELLQRSRAIASSYQERYDHLLVDEFQDTSPLQVGLVTGLRGRECHLFAVGDEFQSIYSFRGADLESFRSERAAAHARSGSEVLPLSGSFRSTPEVVAAVNAIGATLLEEFQPLRVGRVPEAPPPGPGGPVIEVLATERGGWKDDGIEIETAATETEPNRIAEARNLARHLRQLADEGVPAKSMTLLLRAFSNVDAYAEALELAGLDPYVVGGRGYWSAQQVEDALRLLSCLANPLDDEALFGALASPACGASPDALWMLRRAAGRRRHVWPAIDRGLLEPEHPAQTAEGSEPDGGVSEAAEPAPLDPEETELERERELWLERLDPGDRERIVHFGERLRGLRRSGSLLALDALVERTLETFDYDLVALGLPGGRRRAANLLKLIRIAAEYEAHEGRDLRGFLTYAADRAATSDREAEAATAAEEHDGVTVMTIHAAKGLEFDCVAVADLGRRHVNPGAPPELRLDFSGRDENAGGEEDREGRDGEEDGPWVGPRVGLRLARAGAGALTVEGYKEINDEAALSESQESGRLVYVAASRARERLLLSGLADPIDLEGGKDERKPGDSTFARLLPALGAELAEGEEQTVAIPAAEPRDDLDAGPFDPPAVGVRLQRASAEAAVELSYDLRETPVHPAPPAGGKPPMPALTERGGSAARSLSYAALADYNRCGYRFLTERVLGLGEGIEAAGPLEPLGGGERGGPLDSDEEPTDPGPDPKLAAQRASGLGFGRAVHALLERAAREGWRNPDPLTVAELLAREGVSAENRIEGATGMLEGWLHSPLLAELREAGASFRPEVPFRIGLGADTVLRGTIDLLVEVDGRPPLVLDYKTDIAVPAGPAELSEGYLIQRALYSLAISEATGADSVESAYFFLREPRAPLRTVLDRAAIDAGRERIEELIARIRSREFEVTDSPHAALCHDCPARRRLCPHPETRTLARA